MYDENRKFTKLAMFMAENYYSNNSELTEAVSAFEDAVETSGNGEASFGVAGEELVRTKFEQKKLFEKILEDRKRLLK